MLRSEILIPGTFSSIPHCVWESDLLQPTHKLVYLAILDHLGANPDSWPGLASIAKRTKLSVRCVRYAIKRLTEVGLISHTEENAESRRKSGAVNHYIFNSPLEALKAASTLATLAKVSDSNNPLEVGNVCRIVSTTPATLANLSDSNNPLGVGNACQITPATAANPPATLANLPGNACQPTLATVAKEPRHLTTSPNHVKETTSLEPRHSPQPLAAAERDEPNTLNLDQGDQPVKPKPNRALLKVWKQQKRSIPSPAKLETCWKLLALQEKQTNQALNPNAIQPDDSLEFLDLFKRSTSGLYRWQELQARDLSQSSKSLRQLKRTLDKQGSASQVEAIYQAYPKHVGKDAAVKAIRAAIKKLNQIKPDEDAAAFLLERTQKFAISPKGNLGRFTPYPATFYNEGRYADDEAEWGALENRSGNLKREIVTEDDGPGETFQDFCNREK